jgi:hypothetical protein
MSTRREAEGAGRERSVQARPSSAFRLPVHGESDQRLLRHVAGPHRHIKEQHVYEDIMQRVD